MALVETTAAALSAINLLVCLVVVQGADVGGQRARMGAAYVRVGNASAMGLQRAAEVVRRIGRFARVGYANRSSGREECTKNPHRLSKTVGEESGLLG